MDFDFVVAYSAFLKRDIQNFETIHVAAGDRVYVTFITSGRDADFSISELRGLHLIFVPMVAQGPTMLNYLSQSSSTVREYHPDALKDTFTSRMLEKIFCPAADLCDERSVMSLISRHLFYLWNGLSMLLSMEECEEKHINAMFSQRETDVDLGPVNMDECVIEPLQDGLKQISIPIHVPTVISQMDPNFMSAQMVLANNPFHGLKRVFGKSITILKANQVPSAFQLSPPGQLQKYGFQLVETRRELLFKYQLDEENISRLQDPLSIEASTLGRACIMIEVKDALKLPVLEMAYSKHHFDYHFFSFEPNLKRDSVRHLRSFSGHGSTPFLPETIFRGKHKLSFKLDRSAFVLTVRFEKAGIMRVERLMPIRSKNEASKWADSPEVECPICFGPFEYGSGKVVKMTDCQHIFDADCAEKSLKYLDSQCPMCKQEQSALFE